MKKQYVGLDVLRGLGIFSVLILHTSFYYFDGIYDLDLSNPPLIITLIGFVLMFAGLFAMISGFVHTLQSYRKFKEKGMNLKHILKYSFMAGFYILIIAYHITCGRGSQCNNWKGVHLDCNCSRCIHTSSGSIFPNNLNHIPIH